ncbi:MAG: helix-turn-helix domain-containing protein [Streptosporangiaceae bacterium]
MEHAVGTDTASRARGKRPPRGEPVIDRALSLLSAFDAGQRRLSLAELSRRSGIPVSSTLRLAGHLVRWGALERDEEGRYCVGLRLLEPAASAWLSSPPPRASPAASAPATPWPAPRSAP